MRKNSVKNTRVNGEVQRVLAEIIRGGLKDPRISPWTSVVAVEVAPDLKSCKAWISVLGDWIPELTGALAVFMTILLLGPLNFILDKVWKKPAERHPWMDHPENKASGILSVQRLTEILKGYEASLEAARKEREWLELNRRQTK